MQRCLAPFLWPAPFRCVRANVHRSEHPLDVPTVSAALADASRLNEESHYAGTPGDSHIAQWMRDQLAADGFEATLEPFLHDVPYLTSAEALGDEQNAGRLRPAGERRLRTIPTARARMRIPFNAWSGGTAFASVVDAGHGPEADYQALAHRNIDVRTRIVLVRYGGEFRGLLARRALDHGAAA